MTSSVGPRQAASGAEDEPAAPLRIAILGSRGIPANYGGFETFAEQLATRLASRGYQITVYAECKGAPLKDRVYKGVRVRFRRRPRWGAASVLAYDCACLWDACRGYDLVYMLGYGAAWACWWPRLFGVPVWINVDGLEWARSKWGHGARLYLRAMEWFATRAATLLVADADAIASRFRRTYPRGAPCTFVAYGAEPVQAADVEASPVAQWGLQPGQYMLVVARAEPENHLLEIIQGYLLQGGVWPLVVVGDIGGATAYQQRLRQWSSEKVIFLGGIYDAQQLASLRLHAACHVHGHSVGGTNPSLLEAMACGNWVIAHDNPFNREVARDTADYFSTPEQLAQCLERMTHAAASERQSRRDAARAIVTEFYSWTSITDAYERLILKHCSR